MDCWKRFEREAERERLLALLASGHPDETGAVIDDRTHANDNVQAVKGHAATIGPQKSAER